MWKQLNVSARTTEMIRSVRRSDALLSEECMIRQGFQDCPGFAQVTADTLYIDSAFFDIHLALPRSETKVLRCLGGVRRFLGRSGWIGKYRLQVHSVGLRQPVVIGVKRMAEWRVALDGSSP